MSVEGGGTNGPTGRAAEEDQDKAALTIPESEVLVLQGHTSEVFACTWNPRSNVLATGSGDSTARIWTIPDGPPSKDESIPAPVELKHYLDSGAEKSNDVTYLDWNNDGTKLATGSYDGIARIWSETGELLQSLSLHKGPLFALKWNKQGDLLLSGSIDKTTVIWKASTGVLDVDWRDDTSFASCSSDKKIFVCKLGEDNPQCSFTGHQDEINAIKWDPFGKLLASCSDDCTAKIWSMGVDEPIHDFREHTKEIYTEEWCPNTNKTPMLATASFDTTVKLWDVTTGQCINTLAGHSQPIYSIAFSRDGNYIASGSFDNSVRIWSVKDGSLVRTYQGSDGVFQVCWNSKDDKVAASFANNIAVVIDPRMGTGVSSMNIG